MLKRKKGLNIIVITFKELKSEEKKMDFCWHFLIRLEQYNIKDLTEFAEKTLNLYRQHIEDHITTFRRRKTAMIHESR
jgi:hypothetical protein